MKAIQLTAYKYAQIVNPDDVTTFPLRNGLLGLNNKIYATLGSYGFSKGDKTYNELRKNFSEQELRFGCLVRLFELHCTVRTYDAHPDKEWFTEHVDFKDVLAKVKKHAKQIDNDEVSIYMSFNDDGDKTDKELGVLHIPLGSEVFKQAANYAYQEIERPKMDNFMNNLVDSKHVHQFLKVF